MKKSTSAGILLVGAIASLYLIGKGGALGGAGAEKVGAILGSPGAIAGGLPSAGTGSQKQIAAVTGYMAPGTKTAVSPEMRKEYGVGFVPSKTAYAGKQQELPSYVVEPAARSYMTQAGGYMPISGTAPGKGKVTRLPSVQPSQFTGASKKLTLGEQKSLGISRTQAGLTQKGLATQKKAIARKKTPSSGYAAALARSG